MKPTRRPPSEEELDRLLASRIKDTTPEFEARWRDVKRELRQSRPRVSLWAWRPLLPWAGAAAAVVVAGVVVLQRRPPPVPTFPPATPVLAELYELDATLSSGEVLLDAENRDAVLFLPAEPKS